MNEKLTLKSIENRIRSLDDEEALCYLNSIKNQYGVGVERIINKYEKRIEVQKKEQARLEEMYIYEKRANESGYKFIAGVDEAGRGPLAGPVVAAAVILPPDTYIYGVNDSKQLSSKQRDMLYDLIIEKAIDVGVGIVDEKQIDEINILNATKVAMKLAIEKLEQQPDILFIDAVKLDDIGIKQLSIIKGDSKSISVAAASIIAKVTRDRLIEALDSTYPVYGFKKHKGYGTKEHIDAIRKFGICPIHRVSFTKNFTVNRFMG